MIDPAVKDEYLNLNPDAYSRFFIVKEMLKKNFGSKPIKILDVGGGSKYFPIALALDELPYQLTVIDILPPPKVKVAGYKYIQGDATAMSFKDSSFDAVVSMDVLEHVPDEKKEKFIRECYRVASELVIIAGPFETPETTEAETMANDYFRHRHGRDHPWLIEHFEQNKPSAALLAQVITELGCPALNFSSNYLPAWLEAILVNFSHGVLLEPIKVERFNRFYNQQLLKIGDFASPGYRQFYVLSKNPALQKEFSAYFKVTTSTKAQLEVKERATAIFSDTIAQTQTKLAEAYHQLAERDAATERLQKQLRDTARHATNLEAMLADIQSSKSYRFARRLGAIGRRFKKKA